MTLVSAVEALHEQLQASDSEPSLFVADSGIYSEANMRRFNEAKIRWVSRVPAHEQRGQSGGGNGSRQDGVAALRRWADPLVHTNDVAAARARAALVVVRTNQAEARAQATLKRQVDKAVHSWKQKLWHLSNQRFACEADAQSALMRALKGLPVWLDVQSEFVSSEHHVSRGRPRKEATPTMQWHITTTVMVKQPQVEQEVRRKACFIVATNVMDGSILSEQELVTTYKEQGSVERGFRFLRISVVSGLLGRASKSRSASSLLA